MKTYHTDEELYRIAEKRVKDIKGFYWHLFWYLAVNIFLTFGGTIKQFIFDGTLDVSYIHFSTFSVWFFLGNWTSWALVACIWKKCFLFKKLGRKKNKGIYG